MSGAPTLAAAAGHNARWVASGQAIRIGLQLLGLLLLSRLLAPADFGRMAMVVAVTNFALLWRDLGTATALVRAGELAPELASSVFWLNVAIGLAVGLALALARRPIAAALGDGDVAPLLLWVALSFPVQGLAAVPQAMMERACRFRALAAIDLATGLAGLAAAVAAASAGWGAASLALQTVVAVSAAAALLWWLSAWRPGRHVGAAGLRGLLGFSAHLSGFNLVNYFTRNADSLIIGRLLGPAALGPYSLAMRVTLFPVQNLTWAASRALLPLMSRPGQEAGAVATVYLRSLSLIAFFSAPLMAGLFALRADFVTVVLGPQWTAATALLAWLAPVGFVQSVVSTVGPVFLARGRSDRLLRLGLLSMALIVGGLLLSARFDIETVVAAYLGANLLQAGPCLWGVARQLGIPLRVLGWRLVAPLAGAAVLVMAIAALQALGLGSSLPPGLRLVLGAVVGALVYLALAWRLDRAACIDALRLLRLRREAP